MEVRDRVVRMSEQLDPVTLLRDIRAGQQRLADIAHQGTSLSEAPDIESFLRSLRIAWTEGEVRPTAKAKPKQKRERRRPDPLVNVTSDLYSCLKLSHGEPAGSYWSDFKAFIPASILMD